jgi:hypothetical protein
MKLSEAIRMNGMMKPQGSGSLSMYSADAPCALGGALQSIGKQHVATKVIDPFDSCSPEFDRNYWEVAEAWPWSVRHIHDHCPVSVCSCNYSDAASLIYHLNDTHRWTRQQIADWVSVEPQEEAVAVEESVETVAGVSGEGGDANGNEDCCRERGTAAANEDCSRTPSLAGIRN